MFKRIVGCLFLLMLSPLACAFSYTMEITEAELQEKVEAMMPLEKSRWFVTVVVSQPHVDLAEDRNVIALAANVLVKVPNGTEGTGRLKIAGSLTYDAEKGAFYFQDPVVEALDVDDVKPAYVPQIKEIVQAVIGQALKDYPVYTLSDDDLKQKLAKSMLKTIEVKGGVLLVKLDVL